MASFDYTSGMQNPSPDGTNIVEAHLASNGKSIQENFEEYKIKYQQSLDDPNTFFKNLALKYVTWFSPFEDSCISGGNIIDGDMHWYRNGKLNVSYNCIDRHISNGRGNQTAILWEGDEPGLNRSITYIELQQGVCRIANVMKNKGIKKGDVVTIYMPMIPECAMIMLACCRIGAVHSIVFAGFSAESLRGRITDCNSKYIFTADIGRRGGKDLYLKNIVDDALNSDEVDFVSHVFVYSRDNTLPDALKATDENRPEMRCNMIPKRDYDMNLLIDKVHFFYDPKHLHHHEDYRIEYYKS